MAGWLVSENATTQAGEMKHAMEPCVSNTTTRQLPRAGSWAASRWVRHYFHGLIRQYLEQGLKASASNRQLDDREHLAPFSCS
jgi:hypothetical protein